MANTPSPVHFDLPRVSRTDLAGRVAIQTGVSRKLAETMVRATFDALAGALVKDEMVVINGFGSFTPRNRKGYAGRNPLTGDDLTIPSIRSATFKAGAPLKNAMNGRTA